MAEISIIIPTYNAEDFISETIESVIDQSYPNWELIIVDDGSKDRTVQVTLDYVNRDSRIKVFKKTNAGAAKARNYGLSLVDPNSLFIMGLDHDDFLERDALEILKNALNNHPEMIAAYGLARRIDTHGNHLTKSLEHAYGVDRLEVTPKGARPISESDPTGFSAFVIWCWIETHGQVMIRHEAMKAANYFDPGTAPVEDWDMWLRLSLKGQFTFIKRFVMNKRYHANNVTNQRGLSKAQQIIHDKFATSEMLSKSQRRMAQLGHKQSVYLKLIWAKHKFNQRHYVESIKELIRAIRTYYWYLKTPY